ncbi:MAG TPA: hypothetical protein VIZ18_13750 [Ktedonobacteraceae bacterium]
MNALPSDGINQQNISTVSVLSHLLSQKDTRLPPYTDWQSKKTKGNRLRYFANLVNICILAEQMLYYCKAATCNNCLFYTRKRKRLGSLYLLVGSTSIIVLIAIGLVKRRHHLRRQALRQLLDRHQQSGLALVRYVMLNRQCSEERAFQRIAIFVKMHVPTEDQNSIDWLLANDRQSLLNRAGSILVSQPNEIDKI